MCFAVYEHIRVVGRRVIIYHYNIIVKYSTICSPVAAVCVFAIILMPRQLHLTLAAIVSLRNEIFVDK